MQAKAIPKLMLVNINCCNYQRRNEDLKKSLSGTNTNQSVKSKTEHRTAHL